VSPLVQARKIVPQFLGNDLKLIEAEKI
jgi:hypothetical protein